MSTLPASVGPVRVASVPATHVYVRRLDHPGVVRLRDPSGDDRTTPSFLDPAWWTRAVDVPDVLHLHFGFEHCPPARLQDLVDAVRARGVAVVLTLHDLANPRHDDEVTQAGVLDVLVPAADALVTLTPFAADETARRWGRHPLVLPHPHVVDRERLATHTPPRPDGPYRLLLHLRSLRANMAGLPVLEAAGRVVHERDDVHLDVRLHADVVSPRGANHDPEVVALACDLADAGHTSLHVHPYLSHDELERVVGSADGFVLPYVHGTHSGLLELCRDLGTAVVAPDCGGYGDQGARHLFRVVEGQLDGADLEAALHAAVDDGPVPPVLQPVREAERRAIAAAHTDLYARAIVTCRGSGPTVPRPAEGRGTAGRATCGRSCSPAAS